MLESDAGDAGDPGCEQGFVLDGVDCVRDRCADSATEDAVWALVAEGRVRPRVYAELPLSQWRAAFDLLADRTVIGKAVIRPDR